MTRQNLIPREPEPNADDATNSPDWVKSIPALIPMWDLANHKDGEVTSSFNMEKNQMESAALTDFNKGDQIFIYYGARNNTNFLIHNG